MASAAVTRATDPLRTPAAGMMPEGGLKMTRSWSHPQGLAFGPWRFRPTQTPAQRQVHGEWDDRDTLESNINGRQHYASFPRAET